MRFLAVALAAVTFGAAQVPQPASQDGSRLASVLVTVLDRDGGPVPVLQRQDFTVLDNGKAQEIVSVRNDVKPVTFVAIMDFSYSMSANLQRQRGAVERLVEEMLPENAGQIGAFSDKIAFSGAFTSNRRDLLQALGRLPVGNPSRLFDAIGLSIDMLGSTTGPRAVIVFTDGMDTASRVPLRDVLRKARDTEVMIYTVGLESGLSINGAPVPRQRVERGVLRQLARETGGGFFDASKSADLSAIATRIADELHGLYELVFTPAKLDGKSHRLEIRANSRFLVSARRSYIAPLLKP